jgi:hypothetical protein
MSISTPSPQSLYSKYHHCAHPKENQQAATSSQHHASAQQQTINISINDAPHDTYAAERTLQDVRYLPIHNYNDSQPEQTLHVMRRLSRNLR